MNESFKVDDKVVKRHPDNHYNGVEGRIVFIYGGSCLIESDNIVYEVRLNWLKSQRKEVKRMRKCLLVLVTLVFITACSPPSAYQHVARRLGLDVDKYTGQSWEIVHEDLLQNNFKVVKPEVGAFRMLNWKLKGLDIWVAYKGLDRYVKHSCITLPSGRISCGKIYLRKYLIAKIGIDKDDIVRKVSYDFQLKEMGLDYMGSPFIFNKTEWNKNY